MGKEIFGEVSVKNVYSNLPNSMQERLKKVDIKKEYELIKQKKSELPHMERKAVEYLMSYSNRK